MAVDDLVGAANEMYRTVAANEDLTPEKVVAVATRGHGAIQGIQDDPKFRDALRKLSQARRRYAEEFLATLDAYGESQERFERFLEQERAVLLTAGLEPGLVEELLAQGQERVGRAREWAGDPGQVYEQVAQLQTVTADLSAQLKELQQISKALDQAASRNDHVAALLAQEHAEHQATRLELDATRRENQRLATQIDAARSTNHNLIDQIAHTGPLGASRGKARMFWRITYGVGGHPLIVATAAAPPPIGPPAAAASYAFGNVFLGVAIANQ